MESGVGPGGEGEDERSNAGAKAAAVIEVGEVTLPPLLEPGAYSPGFLQKREGEEASSHMFRLTHEWDRAKGKGDGA